MSKFTPKKIKLPEEMDLRVQDYHDAQESTALYMDKFEELMTIAIEHETTDDVEYAYSNLEDRYALAYATLGLTGEAGEVANKIKKYLRGDTLLHPDSIVDELGDVFWYLFDICGTLHIDPAKVMRRNAEKLADRKARGVIKGEGDKR